MTSRLNKDGMRQCQVCLELKPFSEFYKGSNGQSWRTFCKSCHKEDTTLRSRRPEAVARRKARHAALSDEEKTQHKERVRGYHRLAKYGLTNEDWQRLYEMQDGFCGICGDREATHVDHRHTDGQVRMLLCNQCNQMLGLAKDHPSTLRAAADYLEAM